MLAAALAWAARGFRVFPLPAGANGPPFWESWPTLATTDPAQIEAWWRDALTGYVQPYNIGVCTSGLAVIDLDNKKGKAGQREYEALGGAFDTLTVRTPTGGYHLYYRAPRPVPVSVDRIAPGVDVRGENGYVVAPGSARPDGDYSLLFDAPVADMPGWLLDRAGVAGVPTRSIAPAVELDLPASIAAARAWLAAAPPAVEGLGGDARTYQTACEVRDRGVSAPIALDLMLAWNKRCSPPWSVEELRAKVENAYAYAQRAEGEKAPEASFGGVQIIPPEREPLPGADEAWAWGNLPEESDLMARPWVIHELLLRGDVTAILAPGGVGKSLIILQIAIGLALGDAHIFGFENVYAGQPQASMIYNAEDSLEEMAMRVHAVCRHRNADAKLVRPYLSLNSGKRRSVRVSGGRDTPKPNMDELELFMRAAAKRRPALVALDPLSKIHDSPENDNTAMGAVLDILALLGAKVDAPILIGHHIPKMSGASHAGSAGAGRGASNIIDSARIAWTLETMTPVDAAQAGIPPAERRRYLRLDNARAGRTMGGDPAIWLKRESVRMQTGDMVGVLVEADMAGRQQSAFRDYMDRMVEWFRQGGHGAAVPWAEAVNAFRIVSQLAQGMTDSAFQAYAESVFTSGTPASTGETLRISRETGKKMLVLE